MPDSRANIVARAGPPGPYGLSAALFIDGDYAPVRLINVTYGVLELGARSAYGMRPGERCALALVSNTGAAPVATSGILRDVTSWTGGARFVVQLSDPDGVHAALPQNSQLAFNRREAFRVVPETRAPIVARFENTEKGTTFTAGVISVSVTGIGVLLPEDVAVRLMPGDTFRVTFDIPGDGGSVAVVAEMRYETPYPVGSRVGLAFMTAARGTFARQQKQIARYVMALQRKMLRVGND